MPKSIENKLRRTAMRKFGSTTSERARAYIWGTMHKLGYRTGKKGKDKD